jgi:hypothetical protein
MLFSGSVARARHTYWPAVRSTVDVHAVVVPLCCGTAPLDARIVENDEDVATWNSYASGPAGPVKAELATMKVGRESDAVPPLAGDGLPGTERTMLGCTKKLRMGDGCPFTPSITAIECQ